MSTRANIKFQDEYTTFHVDRSHDGFPDNVLPDIESAIQKTRGRWSEPEIGQLITWFLIWSNDHNARLVHYEIASGVAGDESYTYHVVWDEEQERWRYWVDE